MNHPKRERVFIQIICIFIMAAFCSCSDKHSRENERELALLGIPPIPGVKSIDKTIESDSVIYNLVFSSGERQVQNSLVKFLLPEIRKSGWEENESDINVMGRVGPFPAPLIMKKDGKEMMIIFLPVDGKQNSSSGPLIGEMTVTIENKKVSD